MSILATNHKDCDVYGGRRNGRLRYADSPWRNPFVVGRDGDLEECLTLFRIYLLNTPALLNNLSSLAGKRVGCYCAKEGAVLTADDPICCHVQILAKAERGDYNLCDRVRIGDLVQVNNCLARVHHLVPFTGMLAYQRINRDELRRNRQIVPLKRFKFEIFCPTDRLALQHVRLISIPKPHAQKTERVAAPHTPVRPSESTADEANSQLTIW